MSKQMEKFQKVLDAESKRLESEMMAINEERVHLIAAGPLDAEGFVKLTQLNRRLNLRDAKIRTLKTAIETYRMIDDLGKDLE